MPNWCENHIEITGHKAKVLKLLDKTLEGGLFNAVIPLPDELKEIINRSCGKVINGFLSNYSRFYKKIDDKEISITDNDKNSLIQKYGTWEQHVWKKQNWNTGWEAEITSGLDEEVQEAKKTSHNLITVSIRFITGWTPPLKVYEMLVSEGFIVNAHYYEPDNKFYGWFKDGKNNCFDINEIGSIDPFIVKMFSIVPNNKN